MKAFARVFFAFLFLLYADFAVAKQPVQWSNTSPSISLIHIFQGQINRSGKPTGFHHIDILRTPPLKATRLQKILSTPNKTGVYTAIIEIWDAKTRQWKTKFSSMFPNRFSKEKVIQTILYAFKNNKLKNGRKWRGRSGNGFEIEGYLLKDGRIITAYPIYKVGE